jgi:hypothetical protein
LAVLFAAQPSHLRAQSVNSSSAPPSPPVAPVKPVTDDYYGTKIVDPYRYMENLKDPHTLTGGDNQKDRGLRSGQE